MYQLIYQSEGRPGLLSEELFRIIEQSARNNPFADITGFLIYQNGRFLQLVEGPLQALEELLRVLQRDPRHHSLKVLAQREIFERSFPRWRMKRVGDGQDAIGELRAVLAEQGRGAVLPPEVATFIGDRSGEAINSAAA